MKDISRFLFNIVYILLIIFLSGSLLSSFSRQETSTPEELESAAKEFVDLMVKGNFESAVQTFDSVMTKAMPQEKLKEVWESLIRQLGQFKRQAAIRKEMNPRFDIVFVTCEFEKDSIDIKVVFDKKKMITGLWFAPTQTAVEYSPPGYVRSDSFQEKEVEVGSGKWSLPGTLSIPTGSGPFPALVLVHGSGPQDRDESIGPNKPFRDIAWGLASQGIAVLRYEKRTKAHGKKLVSIKGKFTVKEETIDDSLAAVELLSNIERIDSKNIFVLGHSLGGMLIPRIGALDSKIAGFIIMAGTTRALEDVILDQVNYIYSLDGKITEVEKANLDETKAVIEKIKSLKKPALSSSREYLLGATAEYWLDLREYNPALVVKTVKQPMLILQGGRDYQVTVEDFEGWKKSLSSRKNVKFKFYPKLNHLFIAGKGIITPAEYQIAGHVAKAVIDDIALWIKIIGKDKIPKGSGPLEGMHE
ncbi:MAG: DUF3887 domain-containing protein [Candidatus Aminicenantes bacterium]|nr:MAG: DUF3887 domain-containing protein [Candidatus Aminicenantes bacterium]